MHITCASESQPNESFPLSPQPRFRCRYFFSHASFLSSASNTHVTVDTNADADINDQRHPNSEEKHLKQLRYTHLLERSHAPRFRGLILCGAPQRDSLMPFAMVEEKLYKRDRNSKNMRKENEPAGGRSQTRFAVS